MRFALVFAAMVGVPLAVLALVMTVGGGLRAPHSVGGTWELAVEDRPPLEVVQSGPVLELRWGDVSGRGHLVGADLDGRLGGWTLRARRTDDARLVGTLTQGEASPVISFVATRTRTPRGQSEGH